MEANRRRTKECTAPNALAGLQPAGADAPISRLRSWLERSGYSAVVLSSPANVAWLTRGVSAPIDRAAHDDPIWLAVTGSAAHAITTNVEFERVASEVDLSSLGAHDIAVVPWGRPAYRDAALECVGYAADKVASDGSGFGHDASSEFTRLRMELDGVDRDRLRSLGRLAAASVEDALMEWTPGDTDFAVQAAIASRLEGAGARASVLIVGGDERVGRFRHPVAIGASMQRLVMGVVVACRGGLHAAVTRYAFRGKPSVAQGDAFARVRDIETAVLEATRPGEKYGSALRELAAAYARVGAPGAWAQHYQGGPIAFEQREFEIAPDDVQSPWYSERVREGHAIAWNPSLEGGVKVEDTYLVTAAGLERVTDSGNPEWPSERAAAAPPSPFSPHMRPGIFNTVQPKRGLT